MTLAAFHPDNSEIEKLNCPFKIEELYSFTNIDKKVIEIVGANIVRIENEIVRITGLKDEILPDVGNILAKLYRLGLVESCGNMARLTWEGEIKHTNILKTDWS